MAQKSITKNAVLNSVKSAMTLLFPLITYSYTARVLHVEALGRFDYVVSVVTYFLLLSSLGIPLYAVREGEKYRNDHAKLTRFVNEVFSINIYTTLLAYVILLPLAFLVPKFDTYEILFVLISLRIVLNTSSIAWLYSLVEDFTTPAVVTVALQFLSIGLLFAFVHSPEDLYKYVLISNLAIYGSGLFLLPYARKYIRLKLILKPSLKHLAPVLLIFFMQIGEAIYTTSDVTVIGWILGDVPTALYTLATTIYRVVKLILLSVITAVIPRYAYHVRRSERLSDASVHVSEEIDRARGLAQNLMDSLIALSLPALCGLIMLSRPIVTAFAGEEFAPSARPLSLLAVSLPFAILEMFFAQCVLLTYRKERFIMISTFVCAAVNVAGNIILIPRFTQDAAAVTTLFVEILMLALTASLSQKLMPLSLNKKNLGITALSCLPVIAVCFLTTRFVGNVFLQILIAVPLSVVSYGAVQILSGNPAVNELLKTLPVLNRFAR